MQMFHTEAWGAFSNHPPGPRSGSRCGPVAGQVDPGDATAAGPDLSSGRRCRAPPMCDGLRRSIWGKDNNLMLLLGCLSVSDGGAACLNSLMDG